MLDTSALVGSLCGSRRAMARLLVLAETGERLSLASLVYYEWRRGPRHPRELADQQALFPEAAVVPFTVADAEASARLYRQMPRTRARAVDIAIAACALRQEARLWTLNPADFADIPGLELLR